MKKNTQRGITLVALVITIIILLILAAISIQALTNQGLFGRANDAKRESEIANIKEQIVLDIYEKQLEPPVGSITEDQLKTILEKQGTIIYEEDGVTIKGITTAKGYEILLKDIYGGETVAESVPDGATVTPVNDITTWLKTGEISKQYSYTTIEQVIADSNCTKSLMNNENAMKYLARSTEFANAICASETTMTYLGESAYVDDTVLNSDIWSAAICDSVYFEYILNVKVPNMTSNTTPSGEVFAISQASNFLSWYAFDNNFDTKWYGDGKQALINSYLGYKFSYQICVKKIFINHNMKNWSTCKLQGSNDFSNWEDIQAITLSDNIGYFTINNDKYYCMYRIVILDSTNQNFSSYADINELQFYGRSQ